MSRKRNPAKRTVFTPTECIPQPDGSVLVRPGRPVVLDDTVGTAEAARILGVSQRWVAWQCELREFRSAYKPGGRLFSNWRLARKEVFARLAAPAPVEKAQRDPPKKPRGRRQPKRRK
jgi:hypothetical protein